LLLGPLLFGLTARRGPGFSGDAGLLAAGVVSVGFILPAAFDWLGFIGPARGGTIRTKQRLRAAWD